MLTSIAVILLLGFLAGYLFSKMKLPSLLGMIMVGLLIGPHLLDLVDDSILMISGDLRQIALVIILTRAGLSLSLYDLRKVGQPAFLMCFLPACIEMIGTIIFAPILLGVSILDAAIIGSVIAAVSPAVVVPRMIKLIEEGYGSEKGIPQLILAGASVDDVFVIVVFTALTTLAATGETSITSLIEIPTSILLGIFIGYLVGLGMTWFLQKFPMRDTVQVLVILSISFLLLELQDQLADFVSISGLLAIMSMGVTINQKNAQLAHSLAIKYNKLWIGSEVFLFVLVGMEVDLTYALSAGIAVVILIIIALLFRMLGVGVSLLKTSLNKKERLFCALAYTPKATVQAAIGGIPLAMGLASGELILTVAVVSILLTAPFGAITVDNLYEKLLVKTNRNVT